LYFCNFNVRHPRWRIDVNYTVYSIPQSGPTIPSAHVLLAIKRVLNDFLGLTVELNEICTYIFWKLIRKLSVVWRLSTETPATKKQLHGISAHG
jgi:hypothetical protein